MKKNVMMRIASVLMIAVLLTTCVISGTFAKYTASATGTASATVAKWSFNVGTTDIAASDTATFAFDLFATILDANDGDDKLEGNATTDNDVAEKKIAPGTQGSFDIVLTNTSEVTAEVAIDFNDTQYDNLAAFLNITIKCGEDVYADGQTIEIPMEETRTVTVTWEWPFDGNTDNELGRDAATYDLVATVTATQKN